MFRSRRTFFLISINVWYHPSTQPTTPLANVTIIIIIVQSALLCIHALICRLPAAAAAADLLAPAHLAKLKDIDTILFLLGFLHRGHRHLRGVLSGSLLVVLQKKQLLRVQLAESTQLVG